MLFFYAHVSSFIRCLSTSYDFLYLMLQWFPVFFIQMSFINKHTFRERKNWYEYCLSYCTQHSSYLHFFLPSSDFDQINTFFDASSEQRVTITGSVKVTLEANLFYHHFTFWSRCHSCGGASLNGFEKISEQIFRM